MVLKSNLEEQLAMDNVTLTNKINLNHLNITAVLMMIIFEISTLSCINTTLIQE